ncbi:chitinase [Aureibacter tunicatorum]|uniref:Glycoside hydrolase family 19 catalytic domain-containing protein n=1 Tax=Aureibacter tunicatorum TaxID=866807 RepID=A0AAE4BTP9_9BACT|nr:chitinase [Aureibacter tunicatorum]MDR6240926.1 hypothetical protein [Aureibacter tunicatorum]BDD03706.1 hypothetical protein AUTU_11890 [Aureibacter tunicatorum]
MRREERTAKGLSLILMLALGLFFFGACSDSEKITDDNNPEDPSNPGEDNPPQTPITDLISPEEYNDLFSYRCGTENAQSEATNQCGEEDFYSYTNFQKAIDEISNIKVIIEQRDAEYYIPPRITRIDKPTGEEKIVSDPPEFNGEWEQNFPIKEITIDYSSFCNEGSFIDRKRELAAFFANIAQETTGGWETAPGGKFAWGLFYKEELGYFGTDHVGYNVPHENYPGVPGKSYHGRGPIQLSYNYNYGQVSEYLFGDKYVLLNDPEDVSANGVLAFKTAIWFWMTPQFPKPSCHEVMIPDMWTPSPEDIEKGREAGFAHTIAIINGGVECGGPHEKAQSRFHHYDKFAEILGVSTGLDGSDDPNTDCSQIQPY